MGTYVANKSKQQFRQELRRNIKTELYFALALALLPLGGCAGVKGDVVTMESLDQDAVHVHQSGLNTTDQHAFDEAKTRAESGEYDVTNKTIGDMITDQEAYDADQKAQADKAQHLADQLRAQHDAQVKALKDALTVAFVQKDFQDTDFESGSYQALILVKFALHNNTTKTIRAVKGRTTFRTTLGDQIYTTNFEYEEPIGPGKTVGYNGSVDYNQFDDALTRFKNADINNVKLDWEPHTILFVDGSKLEVTQ
jgi:hypothetical protein